MIGAGHLVKRETGLDISSTGEIFRETIQDSRLVSINIKGDATADYALDVSPDNDTYFDAEETYSGTDIRDAFELTDRYLKIRVTSAAGANDTADVTVQGVE